MALADRIIKYPLRGLRINIIKKLSNVNIILFKSPPAGLSLRYAQVCCLPGHVVVEPEVRV